MERVLEALPAEAQVREPVAQRLRSLWGKPRVAAVSEVLVQQVDEQQVEWPAWTAAEQPATHLPPAARCRAPQTRQLLFFPDAVQAALYPKLIASPPTNAAEDHPQVALAR